MHEEHGISQTYSRVARTNETRLQNLLGIAEYWGGGPANGERRRMSISEAIGRFRTAMGIEIAKLCADYAIDLEEELTPLVSYALKHTPDISQLP
jgi:hypothetical protein